jgi:hypothetical protein
MAKLGLNAKLYRYAPTPAADRASWLDDGTETDGTILDQAPADLSVIGAVRDLTLNLEKGEADVTTRGNSGFRAILGTLKDASLEFDTVWDGADAEQVALLASYNTGAVIALAILDAAYDTVGAQGLWADFTVVGCSHGQELEEGQKVTWTIKPALTSVPPEWVEVEAT